MGMYTGVVTDVVLTNLLPGEVAWFDWAVNQYTAPEAPEPPLPVGRFFMHSRRIFLVRGAITYVRDVPEIDPEFRLIPHDGESAPVAPVYVLKASINVKNYAGEVEDWVRWLNPKVVRGSIKWRYEETPDWFQISWAHGMIVEKGSAS